LEAGVLALTVRPRYGEDVSLRRLRYQLECRRSGHDVRPYMVDGTHVVQRCLRCGAIVDESELVAPEAGPDVVLPRRPEPQPSNLPPAPAAVAEREAELPAETGQPEAEGETEESETGEESAQAALSALRELGELHAAGVLTDREFARKKAELLRRV
jgi:putative oligomerization/nucleic acid binding protein